MNLYIQLFIILIITYYLFFYKNKAVKKIEKFVKNIGIRRNMIPSHYNIRHYDLNDLALTKPKTAYPIDYNISSLDKRKVKYFKFINSSLDEIRLLSNNKKETTYNIQDRNPTPINNKQEPFLFIKDYLVDKLNLMSRNLYTVEFIKFNEIIGEEIDEQYKVEFKMLFKLRTKKESHSDKNSEYTFNVSAETIINKPNSMYNIPGSIFFRTLFIDEDLTNHYLPYNLYNNWGK